MTDINKTYLPNEIIFSIGRYLTIPQLARFKKVCKLFNEIGSDVNFLQPLYHRLCRLDETLPPLLNPKGAALEFKQAFEKVKNRQDQEIIFLNNNHTEAHRGSLQSLLATPGNTLEQLAQRNALLIHLNSKIIQENIDRQPGKELNLSQCITRFIVAKENSDYFRNLTRLDCDNNLLTTLNLQNCSALETLYCDNNPVTTLNLKSCRRLQRLYCNNTALTTLDLQDCAGLQQVYCCHNSRLSILRLQNRAALQKLHCDNNLLNALNLQGCKGLQHLYCCNNGQLSILNLKSCAALQVLFCRNNPLTVLNLEGTSQAFQERYNFLVKEVQLRSKKLFDAVFPKRGVEKRILLESWPSSSFSYYKVNKKTEDTEEGKRKKIEEGDNGEVFKKKQPDI